MKHIYLLFFLFITSVGISQECRVRHLFGHDPAAITPFQPLFFGQGFRAECSGTLTSVGFIAGRSGFVPGATMNIYVGDTVLGEPVHTQEFDDIFVPTAGSTIGIELDEEFEVIDGEQYAFEIFISNISIFVDFPNSYEGGSAWQEGVTNFPDADFFFNVTIEEDPLSTDNIELENELKIFPNPSTDFVQVSGLTSSVDYKIYNVLGAEVAQGVISDQEIIDVNDFSNGLYVLQLDDQRVFKFIKE